MVLSLVGSIKGGEISSAAGLRIVILQISEVECSNIVVKSGLKSLTRTSIKSISSNNSSSSVIIDCFLKSCHLCKKPLCPDKDVYMYRGDQGFCSIECRNRQIMVDEMKEMEVKTKKRLATSTATSIDCAGCETCKLLEDLRRRRQHRNNKLKPLIPPTKLQQPLLSFS
ncbi:uncharacterized protein LOC110726712 [Chenopodium quinoa]|uniref:uncharacterized protein LOC110726712 n=1 Tax=Chenopodium quinoa TaxID=63459 RepID=UPI000B76F19A|nr:uncharacterized protein LOC110726712 [Chenopodium quinoa]